MYSYKLLIVLKDELSNIVHTVRCDDCHKTIHVDQTIEHASVCLGGTSHSSGGR